EPHSHPRGDGVPGGGYESHRRTPVAGSDVGDRTGPHLPRDGRDRMNEPGPGQLLFAFVRRWSRYASAGHGDIAENGRLVVVTEAVAGLVGRGQAATVNAVAAEL